MSKVLFINHTNDFFGAERVLLKVMEVSREASSDVYIIEPSYHVKDSFRPAVQAAGFDKIIRLRYKNLGGSWLRSILAMVYNIPAVWRLSRMVRREGIDCIWSNTSLECLGVVVAWLTGVKHVWHIHEPAEKEHDYVPALERLYRILFRYRRNTFVFVTRTQQARWENLYPQLSGQSRLVYTPADQYVRERVADDVCRFGFLGSWSKRKNIPALVEAFGEVHALFPNTELLMAQNKGEDAEHIYRTIQHLPYPEAVHVESFEKVQSFYNRIDVLVLPSFSETWGLVVVEAMQQGIATIVTRQTALNEIATDGQETLFINPYEQQTIVEAMVKMCDKTYRQRIAANALSKMQEMDFNGQFATQIRELL